MLINAPFIIGRKTSVINVPLLIALFITSVVHLLLILGMRIDLPERAKNRNALVITLIKPLPKKTAVVPVPPIIIASNNPIHKPVATAKASVQHKKPSVRLTNAPRFKKRNRFFYRPVTEATPVSPVLPIPVVAPKISVAPVPVVEPKVETHPVVSTAPAPVVVPDATVSPAVPMPMPMAAKIETTPITPDAVPQPTTSQQDMIDKSVDFPVKPPKKSAKKPSRQDPSNIDNTQPALSLDDLATQIAQVGEKFGNLPPTASENRVKSLKSIGGKHKVSARQYILDWQHKVERIGNLNYPEAAREKDFTARLVMEVKINTDGSLRSMRIKKSSGTPALDEAAKNIVQMSAPFAALPKDLAEEMDVLTIQRVWQFSDDAMTTQ